MINKKNLRFTTQRKPLNEAHPLVKRLEILPKLHPLKGLVYEIEFKYFDKKDNGFWTLTMILWGAIVFVTFHAIKVKHTGTWEKLYLLEFAANFLTNLVIFNFARLWDTPKGVWEVGSTIPELRADGFFVRFLVVGGGGGGGRLTRALGLQAHTLQTYSTVQVRTPQLWDGILEWHFQSRFLGIHSRLFSDSSFCLFFYSRFSVLQNAIHG